MVSAIVCQPLAIRPPYGTMCSCDRVDVERLRIVAARERDDLGFVDDHRAAFEYRADRVVLEVARAAIARSPAP